MSFLEAAGQAADHGVAADCHHPDGDGADQQCAARDAQGGVGDLAQPLVGLVLDAHGEQQGRDPDRVDHRLGQALAQTIAVFLRCPGRGGAHRSSTSPACQRASASRPSPIVQSRTDPPGPSATVCSAPVWSTSASRTPRPAARPGSR